MSKDVSSVSRWPVDRTAVTGCKVALRSCVSLLSHACARALAFDRVVWLRESTRLMRDHTMKYYYEFQLAYLCLQCMHLYVSTIAHVHMHVHGRSLHAA
jgi:hypothetical protein